MARKAKNTTEPTNAVSAPPSKVAQVIELLRRAEGATLDEMTAATSWQPHSTRAVLTGLRKKGHTVVREKRGEVTCYRITDAA